MWKTNGEYVRDILPKMPKRHSTHTSHPLNKRRVTCFAPGTNPTSPTLFIGFPTIFDEYSFMEGRTTASVTASNQDWVWSMVPLDGERMLTVTGCAVYMWHRTETSWTQGERIVTEGPSMQMKRGRRRQRPFISGLTHIGSDAAHFGMTTFTREVVMVDIESKKRLATWREHAGKVWNIERIDEHRFATGGDDHSIKIWDIRERSSVQTIEGLPGEVTALLSFDDTRLIAGACPPDPVKSGRGAQLQFFDIRK